MIGGAREHMRRERETPGYSWWFRRKYGIPKADAPERLPLLSRLAMEDPRILEEAR